MLFNGTPPYTFSYSLNGVLQDPITTSINPYTINTKKKGAYTLVSFNDANEIGGVSGEAMVSVLESPSANFTVSPDSLSILYTTTQLTDESIGDIVSWHWDYGDNSPYGQIQNPDHTYQDLIATYQINLIVTDRQGCADTASQHISIFNEHWIYIPNSFTPDLDGKNDKFCISHNGIRGSSFVFNVYDRFGSVVYSTNNLLELTCEEGWDGKNQLTNTDLPLGVYIYEIYYQDLQGWKHSDISKITIIR